MKKKKIKFLGIVASCLVAGLLSACSVTVNPDPTQQAAVIFTAAAQTIEAAVPTNTATPKPTATPQPTSTPENTATVTVTPTPVPPTSTSVVDTYCDNSEFVTDVTIPDNTVMIPGSVFDKTWTFKNTGTCTWKESYSIVFGGGDLMNGSPRFIANTVVSQGTIDVTVRLTAPSKPGTYTGIWRLANSKGDPFGQISSVVIVVSLDGATITLTPAEDMTPTETPTETLTPLAPAETGTPTPTASPTP